LHIFIYVNNVVDKWLSTKYVRRCALKIYREGKEIRRRVLKFGMIYEIRVPNSAHARGPNS
jgi:hypothetical protein